MEIDTHLPRDLLEEPSFDLVGWYHQHLDQYDLYEQKYYEYNQELYLQSGAMLEREERSCCPLHKFRAFLNEASE